MAYQEPKNQKESVLIKVIVWRYIVNRTLSCFVLIYFTNPDETDFKSSYAEMHNIPYDNIVSVRLDEPEGLDANSAKIERMKADFKDNISSDQEETNFALPGRKNLYIGSVFVRAHFRIDNKNKETDAESVMYIGLFNQFIKISEE